MTTTLVPQAAAPDTLPLNLNVAEQETLRACELIVTDFLRSNSQ